jgi:1-acyl-sn-glycerol-3-phosphate acyltransferase
MNIQSDKKWNGDPAVKPRTSKRRYFHARWSLARRFLKMIMRQIGFRFLAKIDSIEGEEQVPEKGPTIIIFNHIAFIDGVAILAALRRNAVPLMKTEARDLPIWGLFTRLWGAIPIRRGEVDRTALDSALNVLDSGEVLLIAPEGTRSPALIEGKEGLAFIAARANATVIPAVVEGTEGFPTLDPKRWSKPGARIRFGRPFHFRLPRGRVPRAWLRKMTDEAMYRLAELLPPARRGVYSDLACATVETLEF